MRKTISLPWTHKKLRLEGWSRTKGMPSYREIYAILLSDLTSDADELLVFSIGVDDSEANKYLIYTLLTDGDGAILFSAPKVEIKIHKNGESND